MSGLRAGYGERLLTPPLGVDLCGYGFYLDRKADGVRDDLAVRALVLEDGGPPLAIVACDLIGLSVADADGLRNAVAAALRTRPARVLVGCSHTHSGPATQSMPGLGTVDPRYVARLKPAVLAAAEEAAAGLADAEFRRAFQAIEPLGYNRRSGDFRGIDPVLKALFFKSREGSIVLFSYACHAVVLGRRTKISADWPGAAVRAAEASGRRALFLQGFCGDIDPVTQMNGWGEGTGEDLELYGGIVARRLEKAEAAAERVAGPTLDAAETRIALPLRVPGRPEIERRAAGFARAFARFPGAARFAADWRRRALRLRERAARSPRIEGVPIQALRIGDARLLAWPAEPFAAAGLGLRQARDPLLPVGYANGDVGYIPSRSAFRDPDDYAAWCAPMFGAAFPFAPDVEAVLARESRRLLAAVKA